MTRIKFVGPDGRPAEAIHRSCRSVVTATREASGVVCVCKKCGTIKQREVVLRPAKDAA